jgi:zinc transporter 2
MLGFVMSMYALKVSLRPASKELTFGWHRAEIIGTLSSVMFLLTITIWLMVEATKRIINPQPVKGFEMLITAVCAFFFNLIQMSMLHQGDIHYHMGGEIGGGCEDDHGHHGNDHEHDHGHHGHDTRMTTIMKMTYRKQGT